MDLLEHLRWHAEALDGDAHVTAGEAAVEIERLRAALERILNSAWEDEYDRRHHVCSDAIAAGWKALNNEQTENRS